MTAIYVVGFIIAFGLGFFICALFRVDGQAPRPIFKPIENLVEPPEDLTTSKFGDDNEKE